LQGSAKRFVAKSLVFKEKFRKLRNKPLKIWHHGKDYSAGVIVSFLIDSLRYERG
jgi:hypothetical protein